MWYLVLNLVIATWVFLDARSRKMNDALLWAVGTSLLMIVVIPFYFADRELKAGEVREGGRAWNLIKMFALFWTVFMFVAGVNGAVAAAHVVGSAGSEAGQTGAAIGTALGLGMIVFLWFIVLTGTLVIGLFLKKTSIIEKGPTGALARSLQPPPTSQL